MANMPPRNRKRSNRMSPEEMARMAAASSEVTDESGETTTVPQNTEPTVDTQVVSTAEIQARQEQEQQDTIQDGPGAAIAQDSYGENYSNDADQEVIDTQREDTVQEPVFEQPSYTETPQEQPVSREQASYQEQPVQDEDTQENVPQEKPMEFGDTAWVPELGVVNKIVAVNNVLDSYDEETYRIVARLIDEYANDRGEVIRSILTVHENRYAAFTFLVEAWEHDIATRPFYIMRLDRRYMPSLLELAEALTNADGVTPKDDIDRAQILNNLTGEISEEAIQHVRIAKHIIEVSKS